MSCCVVVNCFVLLLVVLFLLIVLFHVLFVCKCVLYYCHQVSTQLQLTYISYHIIYIYISYHISYRIVSYHISYIVSYIISYIRFKGVRIKQNKKTDASLTDTSVKSALTPSTTEGSEQAASNMEGSCEYIE